jgi:hypothetical protein
LVESDDPPCVCALSELGTKHRPDPVDPKEMARRAVQRVERARAKDAARERREEREAETAEALEELYALLREHLPSEAYRRVSYLLDCNDVVIGLLRAARRTLSRPQSSVVPK